MHDRLHDSWRASASPARCWVHSRRSRCCWRPWASMASVVPGHAEHARHRYSGRTGCAARKHPRPGRPPGNAINVDRHLRRTARRGCPYSRDRQPVVRRKRNRHRDVPGRARIVGGGRIRRNGHPCVASQQRGPDGRLARGIDRLRKNSKQSATGAKARRCICAVIQRRRSSVSSIVVKPDRHQRSAQTNLRVCARPRCRGTFYISCRNRRGRGRCGRLFRRCGVARAGCHCPPPARVPL